MNIKTISGMLGLVAILTIAGPGLLAQDSGWYLGGSLGQSRAKIDDSRIGNDLLGAGFTGVNIDDRDKDKGYKFFLGYQMNRYLALEGGYLNLGDFGYRAITVPAGTVDGRLRVSGFNLDLVLNLPLTEKFSLLGRVGAVNAQAKDEFTGTGAARVLRPDASQRGTHYTFGGGLQYDFTHRFAMRVEAERYRISDPLSAKGDIDLFSVGALFRFGGKAPAAAPQPMVVSAPAPGPAPVERAVVVVPVATQTQNYCTILDIQFEINEDGIQREDYEKLAVVGTFLTKYPETTAVIEGHTDNVGSAEHNLDLSVSRARNVVAYLVDKIHIAPARLQAVGYGSSRPIADNATEEGKRQNRRIGAVIACATDVEGLTVAPARVTMAMLIEFDRNKAEIKPEYRADLSKVAVFLIANPTVTATVEGHTGNLQGTPELALAISQERAQRVVDFLVNEHGIKRGRLQAEGFGKDRRIAYNTSLEGQQENRRVNIVFNYPRR